MCVTYFRCRSDSLSRLNQVVFVGVVCEAERKNPLDTSICNFLILSKCKMMSCPTFEAKVVTLLDGWVFFVCFLLGGVMSAHVLMSLKWSRESKIPLLVAALLAPKCFLQLLLMTIRGQK